MVANARQLLRQLSRRLQEQTGPRLDIHDLGPDDVDPLLSTAGGAWWPRERDHWREWLADQARGDRRVLVALRDERAVGYGSVIWTSQHEPFRRVGIPEICDLRVAEGGRRRGVGAALIRRLEHIAQEAGAPGVGIGVGLDTESGPAQRLYARLGYVPDGSGATWAGRPVDAGCWVRFDDSLLLWLRKDFGHN